MDPKVKAMLEKRSCKSAGGRRVHKKIRKRPLFNKKNQVEPKSCCDETDCKGCDDKDGVTLPPIDNELRENLMKKFEGLKKIDDLSKDIQTQELNK